MKLMAHLLMKFFCEMIGIKPWINRLNYFSLAKINTSYHVIKGQHYHANPSIIKHIRKLKDSIKVDK